MKNNENNNSSNTRDLTTDDISKSIDSLELGDMSDEKNYLAGLKKQLNSHWSKVKEKLNEDVDLSVKYKGIGSEPYVRLGKKIKQVALTDLGDMSGEKSYLSGLKKHINSQWSTVKDKLNEDVNVKIEYTGIGTEPFVEFGKKVKRQLSKTKNVMLLGQDKDCMPLDIGTSSDIKTIPLKGYSYNHELDSEKYTLENKSINIIGSSSNHSIENIVKKNIVDTKAFAIYISLASNDPLEEFYSYMEMIEKYNKQDVYILVAFINDDQNQHDATVMQDVINRDYPKIGILHVNTFIDEINMVLNMVLKKINPIKEDKSEDFKLNTVNQVNT